MSLMSYFRLVRVAWVLVREGGMRLVEPSALPPSGRFFLKVLARFEKGSVKRADDAERLTQALNRLGPTYVKVGQFLATRPDIVGKKVANSLSKLQDRLPPFDTSIAKAQIAQALGKPCEEIFETFSQPVAAASIAQVHKATLQTSNGAMREVAVKVLRPAIRQRFKNDLDSFFVVARWAEFLIPSMRRLRPVAAIETHARSAELELDLRLEAAALSELGERMAGDPNYRTPDVIWEHLSRDILVCEWIDGLKLSDIEGLEKAGHDLEKLANQVIQSFLTQAVRDGFFHADPHQGNFFVEADGTLVAIDGGIMGRIDNQESQFLAEILWGFINRDYYRIAQVHFEAGYVPAKHKIEDFAQALRGIGEPIHGVEASDISMARLLQQLLDMTDLFDMPLQPQLIFLQRTMLVAEGVSRSLNPNFNMWQASEPIMREWVAKHLGPAAQLHRAAKSFESFGKLVEELPKLAERAEQLSADIGAASQRDAMSSRGHTRGLWAIAAAIAMLAIVLWWR